MTMTLTYNFPAEEVSRPITFGSLTAKGVLAHLNYDLQELDKEGRNVTITVTVGPKA